MKKVRVFLSVSLMTLTTAVYPQTVIGWLETVRIVSGSEQHTIEAKIDSGADHSSIHATNIKRFTHQGEEWVKFSTINNLVFEKQLYRNAKIKTKNQTFQSRPVVWLTLCINGQKRTVETNLVNRKTFSKPLLVGRSALSGFLIDSGKTDLTSQERCRDERSE